MDGTGRRWNIVTLGDKKSLSWHVPNLFPLRNSNDSVERDKIVFLRLGELMACKQKWHKSQTLAGFATEENRYCRRKSIINWVALGSGQKSGSWVSAASHFNR